MFATALHNTIEKYNVLKTPTRKIDDYFREHPTFYKIALLVNHLFRAAAMVGLIAVMPYSFAMNTAICFAGSLFYRLTVETNCAYKFALPAFTGALAFLGARATLATQAAWTSLPMVGMGFVCLRYLAYVVLTVEYDVNDRLGLVH